MNKFFRRCFSFILYFVICFILIQADCNKPKTDNSVSVGNGELYFYCPSYDPVTIVGYCQSPFVNGGNVNLSFLSGSPWFMSITVEATDGSWSKSYSLGRSGSNNSNLSGTSNIKIQYPLNKQFKVSCSIFSPCNSCNSQNAGYYLWQTNSYTVFGPTSGYLSSQIGNIGYQGYFTFNCTW